MTKADTKAEEFGVYQVGEKTYQLAPFTARRLEQVGGLLAGIPVEDLLNACWEIEAKVKEIVRQMRRKGDEEKGSGGDEAALEEMDVDFSLTNIVTALQKVLPAIGEQGLLVKFVAVALNIDEQEAADLPASTALEVVPDFFTANKELFKNSLRSSLPGMILARQVTTPPSAGTPPKTRQTAGQAETP